MALMKYSITWEAPSDSFNVELEDSGLNRSKFGTTVSKDDFNYTEIFGAARHGETENWKKFCSEEKTTRYQQLLDTVWKEERKRKAFVYKGLPVVAEIMKFGKKGEIQLWLDPDELFRDVLKEKYTHKEKKESLEYAVDKLVKMGLYEAALCSDVLLKEAYSTYGEDLGLRKLADKLDKFIVITKSDNSYRSYLLDKEDLGLGNKVAVGLFVIRVGAYLRKAREQFDDFVTIITPENYVTGEKRYFSFDKNGNLRSQ